MSNGFLSPSRQVALGNAFADDHPIEVFQFDLAADADLGKHLFESIAVFLRPFQKGIAFAVTPVCLFDIFARDISGSVMIDLDGEIHDNPRRCINNIATCGKSCHIPAENL